METSRGIDMSLRKKTGVVTGNISGFYTNFRGYIDFTPTDNFEDGLRVFIYTPTDARFFGGEGQVDFHLLPLTVTQIADMTANDPKSVKNVITGEDTTPVVESEGSLPPAAIRLRPGGKPRHGHAPPAHYAAPLQRVAQLRRRALDGEHRRPAGSRRKIVSRNSRPRRPATPFSMRVWATSFASVPHLNNVYLQGVNLTNEEGRDHLSFLKEVLPLPGRNIIVGLRATF